MTYSRFYTYAAVVAAMCLALANVSLHFLWPLLLIVPLAALGTWGLFQTRHSILRNYPILGHLRFLFEDFRPELRQYLFESNLSGAPFNREQRSLVYERTKNTIDKIPFGTELDV